MNPCIQCIFKGTDSERKVYCVKCQYRLISSLLSNDEKYDLLTEEEQLDYEEHRSIQ